MVDRDLRARWDNTGKAALFVTSCVLPTEDAIIGASMKPVPRRILVILFLPLAFCGWNARASNPEAQPILSPSPEPIDPEMARLNHNIAVNPDYSFAYTVRGNFKKARGDLDGALADFNKAVSLDPKNAGAFNNRGLAKQAKRDLPGADADFTQALQLSPNYTDPWYNRARVKKASGDLDGALADHSRVLELDPHYSDAWLRRGNVKKAKGNIEGALADFRLCYKYSGPEWKDYARINLWLARQVKAEKAPASAVLATYLTRRVPRKQWDFAAGIMEFLLDKIDEASFITEVTSKGDQGQVCQAWNYAGMKRLLAGDKPKAVEYFNKCHATQRWDCDEYQFATSELKLMGIATPHI